MVSLKQIQSSFRQLNVNTPLVEKSVADKNISKGLFYKSER